MNKREMRFWARVFENIPDMSPEIMQGWIENPEALRKFLLGLVPDETRLTALTLVTAEADDIEPHEFFKNQKGLWAANNFDYFILSGMPKEIVSAGEFTISYANLTQTANDAEIGAELPEGYIFKDVKIFLTYLAKLIKDQLCGKEGTLLNNGRVNIFYVSVGDESFAVGVLFESSSKRWRVLTFRCDDRQWFAGSRAFSATVAQV